MIAVLPLAPLFLLYVAAMAILVAVILSRSLPPRAAAAGLGVLALWLGWAGGLGYAGVVGDLSLPVPGTFILLAPIMLFVAGVLVRSPVGRRLALHIPLALLIGLQVFRVGVELTLHRLWELGSVPRLMTLAGGNVEILVGLSAPLFAAIATRKAGGRRIALVWNVIGLASLLNVAARAVFSAPGPLNIVHAEVLNTALGVFPFSYIPGFMAPLALMLHVLTFRALRLKASAGNAEFTAAAAVS